MTIFIKVVIKKYVSVHEIISDIKSLKLGGEFQLSYLSYEYQMKKLDLQEREYILEK